MIKNLQQKNRIIKPVPLSDIAFPSPFYEGLQYNAPARGVWNIVHTGMLIPESHQIYVCAQGCLRGVILTAAEMNDMQRMSWVALRERDMWNGEMEKRVIEGTRDILEKIASSPETMKMPRCVLIYLSCMHMFEGCDFQMITDELSEMYPDIDFVECYMIPTMRKTMSPDAMMKISLYEAVKPKPKSDKMVALTGSNLPFDKESDICQLIKMSGKSIWDISDCTSYEEYLELGAAPIIISNLSVADAAMKQMSDRLDQKWLRLLMNFDTDKLDQNLYNLGNELELEKDAVKKYIEEASSNAFTALKKASQRLRSTPIAIDYTAFPYIIELAELLTRHGFNVVSLYSDGFPADERDSFERLRVLKPDIKVYPTNDPSMRFAASQSEIISGGDVASFVKDSDKEMPSSNEINDSENPSADKILAIGQKAAYFNNTPYFVDIVEGGGMYGYNAIGKLAELMIEAFETPKNIEKVIGHKGWGCESCL